MVKKLYPKLRDFNSWSFSDTKWFLKYSGSLISVSFSIGLFSSSVGISVRWEFLFLGRLPLPLPKLKINLIIRLEYYSDKKLLRKKQEWLEYIKFEYL